MNELRPRLCDPSQAESFSLSECAAPHGQPQASPIDEFRRSLLLLNQTTGGLTRSGRTSDQVAFRSLVVSVVGATEMYFRQVLSHLATTCPLCSATLGKEKVPFSTFQNYPPDQIGLALMDGVLFSSRGVVADQIKRVTQLDVRGDAEFSAAIRAYEQVCQVRHVSVHMNGHMDSRAMREMNDSIPTHRDAFRLILNLEVVQKAFAVCDHLVRYANQRLFEHTWRRWLDKDVVTRVTDRGQALQHPDAYRVTALIGLFASAEEAPDAVDQTYDLLLIEDTESPVLSPADLLRPTEALRSEG